MGEHGCAAASLWLEHAPSIGLAIGPRQMFYQIQYMIFKVVTITIVATPPNTAKHYLHIFSILVLSFIKPLKTCATSNFLTRFFSADLKPSLFKKTILIERTLNWSSMHY